ncbi:MAG TPA: hypothetical protein VFN57_12915 [Thermomicrobiaceae bacterium]|nr:hypothetical protein [Thermomicrobiaceae bacterium]
MDSVEVLSEQVGCWGAHTRLYILRCRERLFRVSVVPHPADEGPERDEAYWVEISELPTARFDAQPSIVGNVALSCSGRDPLAAARRVVDRLTDEQIAGLLARVG